MLTAKHKYVVHNTLISLLKGIEGELTTVELRNERKVTGKIDYVDENMNVNMSDTTFIDVMGRKTEFTNFYIQGRNIRYVHIPDHIDVIDTIQGTFDRYKRPKIEKRVPKQRCLTKKEQRAKMKNKTIEKQKELLSRLKELKNK